MKKILIIINSEKFLYSHRRNILEALLQKKWVVDIFASSKLEVNKDITSLYDVIKLNKFKLFWRLLKSDYDVIHVITPRMIIIYMMFFWPFRNVNVVFSFSGFGFLDNYLRNDKSIVKKFLKILFCRFRGKIIVQNEKDYEITIDMGICHKNIFLITGSGFDFEQAAKNKLLSNSLPREVVFLFASRLLKSKGVLDFFEAACRCREKGSVSKFRIAGSYSGRNLSAISKKEYEIICNSDVVEYLGFRSNILQEIVNSTCVVLPSIYGEGLPKILIEASSLGRPIITTKHPGCQDAVIDGETGIALEAGDIDGLTEAMMRLENQPLTCAQLGDRGFEFAKKKFDIRDVTLNHIDIYNQIIS